MEGRRSAWPLQPVPRGSTGLRGPRKIMRGTGSRFHGRPGVSTQQATIRLHFWARTDSPVSPRSRPCRIVFAMRLPRLSGALGRDLSGLAPCQVSPFSIRPAPDLPAPYGSGARSRQVLLRLPFAGRDRVVERSHHLEASPQSLGQVTLLGPATGVPCLHRTGPLRALDELDREVRAVPARYLEELPAKGLLQTHLPQEREPLVGRRRRQEPRADAGQGSAIAV